MAYVAVSLVVTILGSGLFIIIRWILNRYRSHQVLKRYGIPGPKPNFLDGHLYQLKQNKTPHDLIDSWIKKYGKVFGYYMGGVPYIVVTDLDMLKQILIKEFSAFMNRSQQFLRIEPYTHSLIALEDERWKEVRSILTPTFSSSKLKQLKFIFDKKVDIMVKVVREKAKCNEMFDIYKIMERLTLDVIADSALAMKTRCQEDPNDALLLALQDNTVKSDYMRLLEYGVMFPILETIFTFIANHFYQGPTLDSLLLRNLKKVLKIRQNDPKFRSMDVVQLLLDNCDNGASGSKTKLTEKEVISNAFLILRAGYGTTSKALACTFFLLVKHPEVQERLFEEINRAPDSNYDTINELPYLNQVVEESMRIHPTGADILAREVKFDKVIGSHTFPKGAIVTVPFWHLHHNPDLFPDPWKFDPERFSPQNKKSIKTMSYLPFGDGPRSCIGSRFALLEIKLAIFKMLKNFKFVSCEKTEENLTLVTQGLMTVPANGVWCLAIPRI